MIVQAKSYEVPSWSGRNHKKDHGNRDQKEEEKGEKRKYRLKVNAERIKGLLSRRRILVREVRVDQDEEEP